MIISRISMESLVYRTIHETLNRIFGSRTRDPSECETYAEYLSWIWIFPLLGFFSSFLPLMHRSHCALFPSSRAKIRGGRGTKAAGSNGGGGRKRAKVGRILTRISLGAREEETRDRRRNEGSWEYHGRLSLSLLSLPPTPRVQGVANPSLSTIYQ